MADSSYLRQINERKIIHLMLRLRTTSRIELAKIAEMSPATVTRIVDRLIAQSVLSEVAPAYAPIASDTPALGRPIKLLELDHTRQRFLLIQLGVRQTRLAVASMAIPDEDNWPMEFTTPAAAERWLKSLQCCCRKLQLRKVEAVIMSCPGVVDERSGTTLFSPNLRWVERANFHSAIQSIIQMPVFVVQEIRALALGQLVTEPNFRDFLLVDSGDGVGAATVIGGQLQSGHIPLSGELGHTPVLNNDRRCGCGAIGCVETLVSRMGLLKSFHEHGSRGNWDALLSHVIRHGLPHWLKTSLDAAATTVAGTINIEGIPNVLLTGSLTEFPAIVTEYLSAQIRRAAMWSRLGTVSCRTAPRRRMAGLISAGIDRALLVPAW